jgi:hypothetical protein
MKTPHPARPRAAGLPSKSFRTYVAPKDTPRLDIMPENPYFTDKRAKMTLAQLLAELDSEYSRIVEFTSGLTDDQLARKAHIPLVKDTPMGEYPTLAMWIQAIAEYHVGFHIDHMREILRALGKA